MHLPDSRFTPEHAARELEALLADRDRLAGMGEAARSLAMPQGGSRHRNPFLDAIRMESGHGET
jgi:hypothetical protein